MDLGRVIIIMRKYKKIIVVSCLPFLFGISPINAAPKKEVVIKGARQCNKFPPPCFIVTHKIATTDSPSDVSNSNARAAHGGDYVAPPLDPRNTDRQENGCMNRSGSIRITDDRCPVGEIRVQYIS